MPERIKLPTRTKLTEKVLREAVPIVGRDYQIFDSEVRGFAACIYRGGGRAFTLDYRHAGRQRRMTFGRWPEWSVSAARERAKEIRREIDAGADPLPAMTSSPQRTAVMPVRIRNLPESAHPAISAMLHPQRAEAS